MRDRIRSGGLEITNCCNLKCIHCYIGDCNEAPIFMDYGKVIYFIDQLIKYQAEYIVITGGEPFMHPNIESIIHYIGTKCCNTSFIITTNGAYLNDHMIEVLKPYNNIQIQISVDGATKETHERQHGLNTFEHILYVLEHMIDYPRDRKTIRMTISRVNYHECVQFAELAKKYDCLVSYVFVCKVGRADNNWDVLGMSVAQQMYANESIYRYAKKQQDFQIRPPKSVLACPFEDKDSIFGIDICPNGDVNICTCLDGEYIIGNAFTDDFTSFLNSPKISQLTEKINKRKYLLRESACKDCSALNRCEQGCIGRAKRIGDEMGLDDQCDFRRALKFKNIYFLLAERGKK